MTIILGVYIYIYANCMKYIHRSCVKYKSGVYKQCWSKQFAIANLCVREEYIQWLIHCIAVGNRTCVMALQ